MKTAYYTLARLWGAGAVLFCLRLVQNRTGFDPETGLALPSAAGTALAAALVLLAVLELILVRRQSRERVSFTSHFSLPGRRSLTVLAVGCMLLAAGGCLLALGRRHKRRRRRHRHRALALASAGGFWS